jgi:hypothetical protein
MILEDRIPKLIMEWIPEGRSKRGHPRKTIMVEVQAALTLGNREEWSLVFGRRRQLL